jgi:hypothetical protein
MSNKTKICTMEGTAASCVIISDGFDPEDRLSEAQKKSFSSAFKTFFNNASAGGKTLDIGKHRARVTSANFGTSPQISSDIRYIDVTSQFVGYHIITRMQSKENWDTVTIYATVTGGRASPYTQKMPGSTAGEMPCRWQKYRDPQTSCNMFINMDWGDHRTNPSGLARTMIHEFLHHRNEMGPMYRVDKEHRMLDQRARVLLREWGLADGGCLPVNDSWLFGPSYPGCDVQKAR